MARTSGFASRSPYSAAKGLSTARLSVAILLGLLAVLAGCGKVDRPQALFCERVARILFPESRIEQLESAADASVAHGVVTQLAVRDAAGALERHSVACTFAGGAFSRDQLELTQVASDVDGRLSELNMAILDYVLGRETPYVRTAGSPHVGPRLEPAMRIPLGVEALYFLQQVVNALALGCVTSLVAVGYTLVYGIIGVINLAFGDIYMIGAFGTVIGVALFAALGLDSFVASLLLVLPLTMALSAGYSAMTDRLVFRPLRQSSSQMPLIASIGLSIVLQNFIFLSEGARDLWLPIRTPSGFVLAESGGFSLYLNVQQGIMLAMTALLMGSTWYLIARTPFGRALRASSQDRRMAALVGVNVDLVVISTFALGGALAAAGGLIIATYYGGVNFGMGLMMGLKALTAAIVGGIGNFAGALIGGFVVALLETFWAGYFPLAYRELAVFALLILLLVFRPQGILGEA